MQAASPAAPAARACAGCGRPAGALARFCAGCGAVLPAPAGPSLARGLRPRWRSKVAEAPLGHMPVLGPYVALPGRGGTLTVFHEANPTPRLVAPLPEPGPYDLPAVLVDGLLVAAAPRALVALDLVARLSRRLASPREGVRPLPGPAVSFLATDRRRWLAVACQVSGRTEIQVFEHQPREALRPRRVLHPPAQVEEETRWHLWLEGERLLAGQPGGFVTVYDLATGKGLGTTAVPGGLGPLRSHRTAGPLALAADGTLLRLDPANPEAPRLLYRPERGTVWSYAEAPGLLYACVDRTCVLVDRATRAASQALLPGPGVLAPAPAADGAAVLTQDGHLALLLAESTGARLLTADKMVDASGGLAVAPACTSGAVFVWDPAGSVVALEPVP